MKTTILLFITFLVVSCGPNYDGEKRLVFETKITDHNGNPVSGKYVQIQVFSDSKNDYDGINNIISDGFTDANGNILLIFPQPSGAEANLSVYYTGNPTYQDKHIKSISVYDFQNYKLNLSAIQLYRNDELTTLNILQNHTSGDNIILASISLNGVRSEDYFNYRTQLDENQGHYPFLEKFVKNQNLTLEYDVIDYNTTPETLTHHTEIISVGNDAVTNYTITY